MTNVPPWSHSSFPRSFLMLRLRRNSCSKLVARKGKCLFSQHTRRRGQPHIQADVGFGADNLILRPHSASSGYSRPRSTLSPQELLEQLQLRNQRHDRSQEAYDAENIRKMRELYVTPAARVGSQYYKTMEDMRQIEAQALSIGREIVRRSKEPILLRRTFRRLFERCDTIRDVAHVLAIAFQQPSTSETLQYLSNPIVRALFRSRVYATDTRIYTFYYALIIRLETAGLSVSHELYKQCAKFAARSRDPAAMQRALWLFRSRGVHMDFKTFRAIVAKCSIGSKGYGELRNGQWRREDLLPAILGFDGTHIKGGNVPNHHLGSFFKSSAWRFRTAWIQILARCRASDQLWKEWEDYRDHFAQNSESGRKMSPISTIQHETLQSCFIEQMLVAGDARRAWTVLSESKLDFWRLNIRIRTRLFDDAEDLQLASDAFKHQDGLKNALLEKYSHDLERIERSLGIVWHSDGQGGGWHHVPSEAVFEAKLEELSHPQFGHVYGYFNEETQDQDKLL